MAGQGADLSVHPHLARAAVDLEPAEAQQRIGRRCAAPQHGAQAGQQFARVERLGQVVVGAQLQADHAVGGIAPRGEHDDRHGAGCAQAGADLEAVAVRQHQVEDDRVRLQAALVGQGLAHGVAAADLVAVLRQVLRQHRAQTLVVVDQQDLGGKFLRHGRAHGWKRKKPPPRRGRQPTAV